MPLAARLRGLSDRGHLDGPRHHDRIPALIAGGDIGIDPAPGTELNHGSTMIKVAEYLAAGRPVVAYALRETQRTAADAGLYARCGDQHRVRQLIVDLAADPEDESSWACAARERSGEADVGALRSRLARGLREPRLSAGQAGC